MTTANLTREETAARSASVSVGRITVELDLTAAPDPDTTGFPTTTTLTVDVAEGAGGETWLDFLGEEVRRVSVDGVDQPVRWDGARIRVSGLNGAHTIRVEAVGAYSRSGEGMHRFVDPVDGETYLYTQYEPADSRRVMACFEQPDMKARYTFIVRAPQAWRVLSNQSPKSTVRNGDVKAVVFHPTKPISSYITCVVAGPYHRVEGEWRRDEQSIPLGVLCRASLAEHLDADEIIETTGQGLDFFAEAFDYPYPWGKYDQVFVPEYNLGAMENPGIVTFTEAYVFRGAATRAQHQGRANTILHEMAHMWFGDLVTMRWWDDLWLKESFADYMGAHASVAATDFTDAWVSFANRRKAWAYAQDQLPTTHPIVADITDLEAAKLNFDGITYAKGAAVLKQLVAFVGEEAFFEGARRYFRAHEYGSTTLDDLLVELEATSGRDVRAWSKAWLETSGVSTLSVERPGDSAIIRQSDPRPHRLQIGLYDLDGGRLVLRERIPIDIADAETEVALAAADLTLINDADLTYAKARLDERSLDAVEEALSTLDDGLARALVWSSLWNAARDGELPAARYLAIVQRHAPQESDSALLGGVLLNAAFAVEHYVADAERPARRREWLEATWAALQAADAGGDAQLAWARAFAAAAAYDGARADEAKGLLEGRAPAGLPLDPDLRWALLTALRATGRASGEDVSAELDRDDTASGRTASLRVRWAEPARETRIAGWHVAWEDDSLSNDHLSAVIDGVRAGGRRDLIAELDDDYFARIREAWSSRSIEIAQRLVRGLFPASESTDAADAWLAVNADAPGALRRLVIEQRDHLARSLRVRAVQG